MENAIGKKLRKIKGISSFYIQPIDGGRMFEKAGADDYSSFVLFKLFFFKTIRGFI